MPPYQFVDSAGNARIENFQPYTRNGGAVTALHDTSSMFLNRYVSQAEYDETVKKFQGLPVALQEKVKAVAKYEGGRNSRKTGEAPARTPYDALTQDDQKLLSERGLNLSTTNSDILMDRYSNGSALRNEPVYSVIGQAVPEHAMTVGNISFIQGASPETIRKFEYRQQTEVLSPAMFEQRHQQQQAGPSATETQRELQARQFADYQARMDARRSVSPEIDTLHQQQQGMALASAPQRDVQAQQLAAHNALTGQQEGVSARTQAYSRVEVSSPAQTIEPVKAQPSNNLFGFAARFFGQRDPIDRVIADAAQSYKEAVKGRRNPVESAQSYYNSRGIAESYGVGGANGSTFRGAQDLFSTELTSNHFIEGHADRTNMINGIESFKNSFSHAEVKSEAAVRVLYAGFREATGSAGDATRATKSFLQGYEALPRNLSPADRISASDGLADQVLSNFGVAEGHRKLGIPNLSGVAKSAFEGADGAKQHIEWLKTADRVLQGDGRGSVGKSVGVVSGALVGEKAKPAVMPQQQQAQQARPSASAAQRELQAQQLADHHARTDARRNSAPNSAPSPSESAPASSGQPKLLTSSLPKQMPPSTPPSSGPTNAPQNQVPSPPPQPQVPNAHTPEAPPKLDVPKPPAGEMPPAGAMRGALGHGMTVLGAVPVAIDVARDLHHGHIAKAVTTGGTFGAVVGGAALLTKTPIGKAIPVVGGAFGAYNGGTQAYHEFKAGNNVRGTLDSIKAAAYGTAAVAGVATAADCWNPTVIAPAVVAGGAMALGTAIDTGEAIYDSRHAIASGVTSMANSAKGMWNWATGTNHQTPSAHLAPVTHTSPAAPARAAENPRSALRTQQATSSIMERHTTPVAAKPADDFSRLQSRQSRAALRTAAPAAVKPSVTATTTHQKPPAARQQPAALRM